MERKTTTCSHAGRIGTRGSRRTWDARAARAHGESSTSRPVAGPSRVVPGCWSRFFSAVSRSAGACEPRDQRVGWEAAVVNNRDWLAWVVDIAAALGGFAALAAVLLALQALRESRRVE